MANITIYKDNITERNEFFEKLVLKTQKEMKNYLTGRLGNLGKVHTGDGYIYHEGKFPVLLCAHMDTVHKQVPNTMVYANGTLSSPQGIGGDDRCGIYMILEILKKYDCHVVFLENEEIGCVGAKKFIHTKVCKKLSKKGLKYIIEFDRKGNNHAVTYDCDNPEFDEFITKEFFKKEYGTCSDISYIAPALEIAAVNLSCGYYKEHNLEEWVVLDEMENVIKNAMNILERTKELKTPFKYIKGVSMYGGYGGYGYYGRYNDYDWDYGYNYNSRGYGRNNNYSSGQSNGTYGQTLYPYLFKYKTKSGTLFEKKVWATGLESAFYKLFKENQHLCYADIITYNRMSS